MIIELFLACIERERVFVGLRIAERIPRENPSLKELYNHSK